MSPRAFAAAAISSALALTLAYQRSVAISVSPADPSSAQAFGARGRTAGKEWRWTSAVSHLVLRDAGQIVPSPARLRIELGLPRWEDQKAPRRVVLALEGVPLGLVEVSGFQLHEFPLGGRSLPPGDWRLSLATETFSVQDARVALVGAEVMGAPPPTSPPLRTGLLFVVFVVGLQALLEGSLERRRALLGAMLAAASGGVALAFARQAAVLALPYLCGLLGLLLLSREWRRAFRWLGAEGRRGIWAALAPPIALAALVCAALRVQTGVAFVVALLAMGAWAAATHGWRTTGREASRPRDWALPLGLFLLALGFRLYRLEDVPFAIFRDEARHGLLALRLLADSGYRPLFLGPPINQPLPYFLAVAWAIRIFGPSLFALRLVSALAGAGAVPLLYLLVRDAFGSREGAIAALLLAASSWHVSISRFAVNYVEPSLFSLPAYWLLLRGTRELRVVPVCLSALLVSLAQYSAHTAKALLLVVACLVVDEAVGRARARGIPGLRRILAVASAAAAVAALTLCPLLLYVRASPREYLARAQQVSLWSHASEDTSAGAMLLGNLRAYTLAFHVGGDPNGRHHLPGAPFVDPLSGLGLLAGLAVALAGAGSRENRFLLYWLAAGLLPGIVTVDAPSALRTVEAAPAVYATAAVGLAAIGRRWSGPGEPRRAMGLRFAAALGLAAAVAWNGWVYFVRMYDSPAVWRRFAPIATHLGKKLRSLRAAGELGPSLVLALPDLFLEDPDTLHVLRFYWPEGLELKGYRTPPPPGSEAVVLPNLRDYWALVAREEPRYTRNAIEAEADQETWTESMAPERPPPIVGPSFPGTDRPTFWLFLEGSPTPF